MTALQKINGVWVNAQDIYLKQSGSWNRVNSGYYKTGGVWTPFHQLAPDPLSSPLISLQEVSPRTDTRYIKVGIRYPASGNEGRLRLIRVVGSSDSTAITNYNGKGYFGLNDYDWPYEAWSDWFYNVPNPNSAVGQAPAGSARSDSSSYTYKAFKPNFDQDHKLLTGGQQWYFGAWTQDDYGQWSTGVYANLFVHKTSGTSANFVTKEVIIAPRDSGTMQSSVFTPGDLHTDPNAPIKHGAWFYGNQITDSVGQNGSPTIDWAKIRVTRDDTTVPGVTNSNVWLYWHTTNTLSGNIGQNVPVADRNNITNVGTIAPGQTKTFDVPSTFFSHMNSEMKGIGIAYNTSSTSIADIVSIKGKYSDIRSGELHIHWDEAV